MSLVAKRPAKTLMEVAIARQGIRKGASVVGFIVSWAIACEAVEHPLTLDEYAEWWKESPATAYRQQARFRETFPGHATPQVIVDAMLTHAEARQALKRGIPGVGSFPLAGLSLVA